MTEAQREFELYERGEKRRLEMQRRQLLQQVRASGLLELKTAPVEPKQRAGGPGRGGAVRCGAVLRGWVLHGRCGDGRHGCRG